MKAASFDIESVTTNAGYERDTDKLIQWAEIKLRVEENFDFEKGGAQLLKKLQAAVGLVGKGE